MESMAKLISALSSLAWPALFGIVLYKFYQPLKILIESARSRKFIIKVAGNELTMEEASEQQRMIVNDIQSKLAEVEKRLASIQTVNPNSESTNTIKNKHILWVDDNPRNNSYLVASLQEKGHTVDFALSTDEAIAKFTSQSYDIVISDMGRPDDGKAGITLVKQIRALSPGVPFYIFCGAWAARSFHDEALKNGATDITSSGTTLLVKLPL
jgi:CheY-like chemotaxis protein